METKYYLPLSSECLAHYFGGACIMPSRYLPNKPADIQNRFDDNLLITTNFGTSQVDCCLEVVFAKNELSDLLPIKDGFYLYIKPLPVTRVKRILFNNENQKQQTVTNITMSTAFIPVNLIKVIDRFDEVAINELEKPSNLQLKDWSSHIKKFNSLLGGFALMRIAGGDYMNYSENYFSSLATYSSTISNELLVAEKQFRNLFNDQIYKKVLEYLYKEINDDVLDQIASEEKQIITKDKITRIIDLSNLKDATFIIAVLNTYGVGDEAKKKKIDGLILSNFKSDFQSDKSEIIALCYGLNRGYSVFSNKYKSENREKIIKFELNSQLDYYTIESLYQYSFSPPKGEEFPYLDDWCPKQKQSTYGKKKNAYKVLDIMVIGKKKPKVSSGEYVDNLLRQHFQKESEGYFKDFIERIRTAIANDLTEEFFEEISAKDDEIKRLKTEQNKVHILESEVYRLQDENANMRPSLKMSDDSVPKQMNQPDSINEPKTNYNNTGEEASLAIDLPLDHNHSDSDPKKNAKHKGNHISKTKEQNQVKPLKKTSNKDNTLFDKQ